MSDVTCMNTSCLYMYAYNIYEWVVRMSDVTYIRESCAYMYAYTHTYTRTSVTYDLSNLYEWVMYIYVCVYTHTHAHACDLFTDTYDASHLYMW